jgi:hypothetical protein
MAKVAAVDLTYKYMNAFEHWIPSILPDNINEASQLFETYHETFPIFQVEPTNIRGAYRNWKYLIRSEDEKRRAKVLENDDLKELEASNHIIGHIE